MTTNVLLIEDDPAVRNALVDLIRSAGMQCIAYACAEDFLKEATAQESGCVLTDVRLPHMSGVELQAALTELGFRLPIIFLTAYGDIATSVQTMRAGAFDFLEKPVDSTTLLDRLRAALETDARRCYADGEKRQRRARLEGLTTREREVLTLVVSGSSNKEIAKALGISHRTIEVYRSRMMQKLQVGTLLQLVSFTETCALEDERTPARHPHPLDGIALTTPTGFAAVDGTGTLSSRHARYGERF